MANMLYILFIVGAFYALYIGEGEAFKEMIFIGAIFSVSHQLSDINYQLGKINRKGENE